jgi:protein-disulfide isomerase
MIVCFLQDKAHGRKFIAMIPGMSLAAISRTLLAGLSLAAGAAHAQGGGRGAADAALVEQVREAVIRELRESGALDRAVDEGVERFVERQRAEAAQRDQREAETRTAAMRPVSKGRDHIRGNPEAPVTLIEYSDFECPFCKRFHVTVKKLVEESGGQVRWVYRHFPLEQLHPVKARREALASECAAELGGNEAFWKFADRFYELTPSNNRTDVDTVLPRIAREIGLDHAKFAACLASGRHDRRVQEDYENATATGGRGTPWSIVVSKRGKTYPLSGALSLTAVKELVERARRER